MPYVVQSSEKVRGIGADYETKAMLYLMNCRDDSYEINFFAIDFYNDVTGLNVHADKAWDVQSKGTKSTSAKGIGRELVTLFKNEMSDLNFDYLILFMADVPETFRTDATLTTFEIDNIKDKALKSVRQGLIDEANKRTRSYIDAAWITNENIKIAGETKPTGIAWAPPFRSFLRGAMLHCDGYFPVWETQM